MNNWVLMPVCNLNDQSTAQKNSIANSPPRSCRFLFPIRISAAFSFLWLGTLIQPVQQASAAPTNTIKLSALKIQYRDLIDESTYGHSGRSARTVLNQLAQNTPEGIAEELVKKDLDAKAVKIREEIANARKAKKTNLIVQKEAELDRIYDIRYDSSLLGERVTSFVNNHQGALKQVVLGRESYNAALIADIEPVCEPAAFVLNDALAQKDPKTLKSSLVELADFYPPGEIEPGWVDLIRTRRFVVYTDGGSYCRLFLPGDDAQKAWKAAYPVVRHILKSLLKKNGPSDALNVDVYGYQNDISKTTFTLHLPKYTLKVASKDLGTPAGQKPLGLGRLTRFFNEGLILEGSGVNADGQLVLIGSKGNKPTLEGHPITLSDLAVAYRASAYAGHGESYMSIDPSYDPEEVNINFGGRLQDTRMGWVAYRCDLRFKTLGDDFDAVTFENLGAKIRAKIPDYSSLQRRSFSNVSSRNLSEEYTRFWFYPDNFKVVTAADSKSCMVMHPRFTAAAERQAGFLRDGKAADSKTPPWTSLTLAHFNKNYDKFATIFPEVGELDHAARLLAVAEWLYQAKQKGIIALDLDELLTVPLPVNPTPRKREQLHIEYAYKNTGTSTGFKAYCLATPQGRMEYEKDYKKYENSPSGWQLFSVIGGGLDFSARNAVKQVSKASKSQQPLLEELMAAPGPIKIGKKEWKSSVGSNPPPPPPHKGFLIASAPEPGPIGMGFFVTKRRVKSINGNVLDNIIMTEGRRKQRIQTSNANGYFKDVPQHSVWVGEHGTPQHFGMKTTEGVISYRIAAKGSTFKAERLSARRVPSESEAASLAVALRSKNSSIPQVWNMAPIDADIRALDITPSGEALVYYKFQNIDVVRSYKGTGKPTVLTGPAALSRMRMASREKVKAFSVPNKVELLHAALEGDDMVLQIGKREPVRVNATEWGLWLNAKGDSNTPAALAPILKELTSTKAELVVMRDALQSKPTRLNNDELLWDKILDMADSPEWRKKSRELSSLRLSSTRLQEEIDYYEGMLTREPDLKAEIEQELLSLKEIQKLSQVEKDQLLTKREIEFENESLASLSILQSERDAVWLASTLKVKLRNIHVSFDDPSPLVPQRVLREPLVKSISDVGLAIPPGDAGVDDKGILKNVEANFRQNKITLIKSPADLAKVGNVIVITAHNDEALFDYIQSLGDHKINGKSALDGKFLMLTTCFEEGNPNMVSELLRRYNCAGVHVQTERVNKDAVRRALFEFSKSLRNIKADSPPKRLRDIFDDSVKRVLASDDPGITSLKPELEKLLRSKVQWCALPQRSSLA